jgi:predicted nucleic acid-binding protein
VSCRRVTRYLSPAVYVEEAPEVPRISTSPPARGKPLKEYELLDRLFSGLVIAYPDARFAPTYARLLAAVERTGRSIASMDLLIATAAIVDDAALRTRNVQDFSRVPGLRVLRY